MRVDEHLLAGLGVLEHEQPQVGQLRFQRILQPHRDDFVPLGELAERPLPARRADEVRDDEQERAPVDEVEGALQQCVELRALAFGQRRALLHGVQDGEHLAPAGARRDHVVHVEAVEDRADAVAVAREEARQQRDEIGRQRALLHVLRAEVDRARKVEQEPAGDLAILVVLAHVRGLQPRGDVPVDVAHVVAVLVLADIGEIQAEAAEEGPVIAVQQPVETADHRPLEAPQDRLRIAGRGFRL